MATRRGDDFYVVVNGATKHGDIDESRATPAARRRRRSYEGAGAARAAGAARRPRCSTRIAPGRRRAGLHGRRRVPRSAAARPGSAARAIPARTGSRFRCRRGRGEQLADALLADQAVKPIGLGARDSLRLEAGLPLYGHDLDRDDDAGDGRPHLRDQQAPPRRGRLSRRACGSSPSSRTARRSSASASTSRAASRCARARWSSTAKAMRSAGSPAAASRRRCSGRSPWAMSPRRLAEAGTALKLEQRGKLFEAQVAAMPFVPHRYHRKGAAA